MNARDFLVKLALVAIVLFAAGCSSAGILPSSPGSAATATPSPATAPSSESGLAVAFVKDGNIQLWVSLNRVIKDGRPGVPLTNAWLEVEGDLTRLAKPLGLSSRMAWPYVTAAVVGRGENLRSTLHLVFPESVTGPLEPWHLPTNIICEPLISFTAWRGLRPLLGRSDTLQKLAGGQLPNEFYGWAQQPVALQSLWAFPSADPTNLIQSVVRGLPELLSESWRQRGLAQIQWQSTNEQATWRGLPLVVPYLYPDRDAETTFVVGGLFPSLNRTTSPTTGRAWLRTTVHDAWCSPSDSTRSTATVRPRRTISA